MQDNEVLLPLVDEKSPLPSFYELTILSQIDAACKPAFRHILQAVSDHLAWPNLIVYAEELFLTALLLVHSLCICYNDAVWNERLFGLVRVNNIKGKNVHGKLFNFQKFLSIIALVALPRLISQLNQLAKHYRSLLVARSSTATAIFDNMGEPTIFSSPSSQSQSQSRNSLSNYLPNFTKSIIQSTSTMMTGARQYWYIHKHGIFCNSMKLLMTMVCGTDSAVQLAQFLWHVADAIQHVEYAYGLSPHWDFFSAVFKIVLVKSSHIQTNNGSDTSQMNNQRTIETNLPELGQVDIGTQISEPVIVNDTGSSASSTGSTGSSTGNSTNNNTTSGGNKLQYLIYIVICVKLMSWWMSTRSNDDNNNRNSIGYTGGAGLEDDIDDDLTAVEGNTFVCPLPPDPLPVGPGCCLPVTAKSVGGGGISSKPLCPICCNPRVNSCVSNTGHIFCYSCLLRHVREHHTCPVTGVVCPESSIIRLFDEPTLK